VRDTEGSPASFADIAVSLTLALSKMRLDLAQTMIVARSIGMTEMGMEVVTAERERDIARVADAVQLFKDMSEVEHQVRAVIDRKQRGHWSRFVRAAVV
jgi:hypothetical protein